MERRRPIVITGFMGCGKTEVARALARRLEAEMLDLDEFITRETGRTPAKLIDEDGEPAFRDIEFEALTNVLENKNIEVLALGGGAWIQFRNRELLTENESLIVWLDTPFQVCWTRIESAGEDRPLGRTKEQAHELYKSRLPTYQLATMRVHAEAEDTPSDIAARIQIQLES
jgi:shikimate kinase